MTDKEPTVRPIREDGPAGGPHRPPRLPFLIGVLAVGAVIGWGVAMLGGGTTTTANAGSDANEMTDATNDGSAEPVTVTWSQAGDVPSLPAGTENVGTTNPVEMGGRIYVVVRFEDSTTGAISNELWDSSDGLSWRSEPIQLDEGAEVTDLVATRTALILSGSRGGHFAIWRSLPGRAVDGGSFAPAGVMLPDRVTALYAGTAVNEAGEIVSVVIGDYPIWRDVIAPYVPDGVDAADPGLSFFRDSVYSPDFQTPIVVFDSVPEVVVTGDAVWVRLTTPEGEQILHTYDLPEGAFPVETTPDLGAVRIGFSWRSANGVDFLPVAPGSALPDGYFLPLAWRDGFITAGYENADSFTPFEDIRLWGSETGRAWEPIANQPPSACTRFEVATSRDHILLTDEDGARCVGTAEGSWHAVDEPSTVTYAVGSGVGFIGYARRHDYRAPRFSRDGIHWSDPGIPLAEPYLTVAPLSDRIIALSWSRLDRSDPGQIHIAVGTIGG